eukprot:178932_1
MDGILLSLLCIFSTVYGQRDCLAYVGKKLEFVNINGTVKPPTVSTGWTELFSSDKGNKIEVWSYSGTVIAEGTYTLQEADNNQECYLNATYSKPNMQECITFSPTLDHHSIVGCYVWNGECVRVCANTPSSIWYSAVTMTPQTEKRIKNIKKKY